MTTQEKLVKRKLSISELADFLKNVSQGWCKTFDNWYSPTNRN